MINYDFEQKVANGILKLDGKLSDEDAPELKKILKRILQEDTDLVIDLCGVDLISPESKHVLEEILAETITGKDKNLHIIGRQEG